MSRAGDIRSAAMAAKPNSGRHRWRPRPMTVVTVIALVGLLVAYRRDIPAAARAIVGAHPGWLGALFALALVGVACVGLLYRSALRATRAEVAGGDSVALGIAAYAVNLVVKSSGLAGVAVFTRHARSRRLTQGPVVAGYMTATFLNHFAFAAVLVAAIVALVVRGRFTVLDAVATAVFAGYLAIHILAAWAALRRPGFLRRIYSAGARLNAWARRAASRPARPATGTHLDTADELRQALLVLRDRPGAAMRASLWALSVDLVHVVWLWAALKAVGSPAGLDAALVAYGIATLFGIVGFLPAGLGFVEVGMAATLASYSVPVPEAAAAVVLFRVAELWLPLAAGGVASRILARRSLELAR